MALSAVSTRWNLLAGFCAASLALGCGDSGGSSKAAMDGGGDGGGGNDTEANTTGGGKPSNTTGSGGLDVADLGDNVAGKACKGAMDCEGDGAVCADKVGGIANIVEGQDAPGGYCSGPCTADTDCGAGGACAGAFPAIPLLLPDGLAGACQQVCKKDADCRKGYICNDPAAAGGGAGGATTGMGTGGMTGGPALPPQPATCIPKAVVADLSDEAGKACAADADCGTRGRCAMGSIGGFGGQGGTPVGESYCTGDCLVNDDCGTGGVCIGANGNNPGDCYLGCKTVDEDCTREGYYCALTGQIEGNMMVIQEGANACVLKPAPEPLPEAGMPDAGGTTGGDGG